MQLLNIAHAVAAYAVLAGANVAAQAQPPLEGRIRGRVYVSPDRLFQVDVPVMRNPFVKEPSVIHDRRLPNGAQEVEFAVPDLGEVWRYGVRPVVNQVVDSLLLATMSTDELARWLPVPGVPQVVVEDTALAADGKALIRVYYQEQASLLFRVSSASSVREAALIGIAIIRADAGSHLLYVVGQFDMPNQGGFYTLETERGRVKLAAEHLHRMREMATSLRLLAPR